jgi:hypothetical protein
MNYVDTGIFTYLRTASTIPERAFAAFVHPVILVLSPSIPQQKS